MRVVIIVHVFVCICVLVVRWGQGNMRDILFQHIPSGADLMTRDLKMYMLGKEREGWGGSWGGTEREAESSRVRNWEQNGWKLQQIKQNESCKCVLPDTPICLSPSLGSVLTWPQSYPSAETGSSSYLHLSFHHSCFNSLFLIHFFHRGFLDHR